MRTPTAVAVERVHGAATERTAHGAVDRDTVGAGVTDVDLIVHCLFMRNAVPPVSDTTRLMRILILH
jgi:hypothetical protein